jgi:hypothetical protein
MPCSLAKNPDERKCKVANVAERRRKLAGYEVAGDDEWKIFVPESTME